MSRKDLTKTPDEETVLADIAKQEAEGGDPFGDEEQLIPESIEAAAAKDKAKIDEENGPDEAAAEEPADKTPDAPEETDKTDETDKTEGEKKVEDPAGLLADERNERLKALPDDAPDELPRLRHQIDRAKLDTERATLETREAVSLKKLMDGEIEPDAHSKEVAEVRAQQRKLDKAESMADFELGAFEEAKNKTIGWIIKQGAKDGVDYSADKAAALQFDTALRMTIEGDPKLTYKKAVSEAHAMVLARRGIQKAQEPAKVDKTPPARTPGKAPTTLRGLPQAASMTDTGDLAAQLGRLKGQAYQDAFAKLTDSQKAKLLDD
jgi:hypothetical protein